MVSCTQLAAAAASALGLHTSPAGTPPPVTTSTSGCHWGLALSLHHVYKLLKADVCIMGPWGGLWVVLDGHGLLGWVDHASAGAVVQVDVRHLNTLWQRRGVDGKVVVLRADLNAA